MKQIKVLSVFGTRPEAIKMVPLIKLLQKDDRFISLVTVTAQHREMLDQVLNFFSITPDYDLDMMKEKQSLSHINAQILEDLSPILNKENPDIVLVHGDTLTAFASATAAFYQKIKVGHIEAGLRTNDKWSPFPEEMNRQLIDTISDIYFAPTLKSKKNLEKENHAQEAIFVTGNTAIDVMSYTVNKDYQHKVLSQENERIILLTMHRRENIGEPMRQVFRAITRIAQKYPDIKIIFPVHRNPEVQKEAQIFLKGINNLKMIEPLGVADFHNFVAKSFLILTDSGGIQEEAPTFGVPVLVLRDTTERPEGVESGTLKLIGTKEETVFHETVRLLDNPDLYHSMAKASNPYGDGKASVRILDALAYSFGLTDLRPKDFYG